MLYEYGQSLLGFCCQSVLRSSAQALLGFCCQSAARLCMQALRGFCWQSAYIACQQALSTEHELNADTDGYGFGVNFDKICCQSARILLTFCYLGIYIGTNGNLTRKLLSYFSFVGVR